MKTTFTATDSTASNCSSSVESEGLTVSIAGGEEVALGVTALAGLEEFLNSSMQPRPEV
jgi:hypothetical protein